MYLKTEVNCNWLSSKLKKTVKVLVYNAKEEQLHINKLLGM